MQQILTISTAIYALLAQPAVASEFQTSSSARVAAPADAWNMRIGDRLPAVITLPVNEGTRLLAIDDDGLSPAVSIALRANFSLLALHRRPSKTLKFDGLTAKPICARLGYTPSRFLPRSVELRRQMSYELVENAACENGIPPALLDALVIHESGYRADATSPVGAYGLAQLMPGTARTLSANRYIPSANINAGARYLRMQLERFTSPQLALAAYNAGPERVARRGAIPNIVETQTYVANIMASWKALSMSADLAQARALPRRAVNLVLKDVTPAITSALLLTRAGRQATFQAFD